MLASQMARIVNTSKNVTVGRRIRIAENAMTRLVGLLTTSKLGCGEGLLICPSSGVHTVGMRYPIDVVSLDKHLRVIQVYNNVHPWRIAGMSWRTSCVLEAGAGTLDHTLVEAGDVLELVRIV